MFLIKVDLWRSVHLSNYMANLYYVDLTEEDICIDEPKEVLSKIMKPVKNEYLFGDDRSDDEHSSSDSFHLKPDELSSQILSPPHSPVNRPQVSEPDDIFASNDYKCTSMTTQSLISTKISPWDEKSSNHQMEAPSIYGESDCTLSMLKMPDQEWDAESEADEFVKPAPISKSKSQKRVRDRYDSVYRSLLRRFRKFYNKDFDDKTRFKALKRYRNEGFFLEWVVQYANLMFPDRVTQDLIYNLANLIYPNHLVKHLQKCTNDTSGLREFLSSQSTPGEQLPTNKSVAGITQLLNEKLPWINDILLKFTFSKMEFLLSNPSYACLFVQYYVQIRESLKQNELYAIEQMLKIWNA